MFAFLFGPQLVKGYSNFEGVRVHGNDTRTQALKEFKETIAHSIPDGSAWIIKESQIHREETWGYGSKFQIIEATEALKRFWKEKPIYILTGNLEDYEQPILKANKKASLLWKNRH